MAVAINPLRNGSFGQSDGSVSTAAAVLTNGQTVFTIAGGPISVIQLVSVCIATNSQVGATTLRWSHDPTDGAATTFSGISGSIAALVAGASLLVTGAALTTVPTSTANGAVLGATATIVLMPGIITTTVATGPSLSTWSHYLWYRPLGNSSFVY